MSQRESRGLTKHWLVWLGKIVLVYHIKGVHSSVRMFFCSSNSARVWFAFDVAFVHDEPIAALFADKWSSPN